MNEFELITHYFATHKQEPRSDVLLGIGDDCAILTIPTGQQLLVSIDTLVNGIHFPESTAPYDIGYKSLAVNLSDLAAMGATPAWFTLALTLPKADQQWLSSFSEGLFQLAEEFKIQLVGGDTTRGPLSITIQVHGFTPMGKALTRKGAQIGDWIYVTNHLGDAGLALQHLQKTIHLSADVFSRVSGALNRPYPRINEGLLLAKYATSMIDLSDGLISDLGHVLKHSRVGALIKLEQLPLSSALKEALPYSEAIKLALSAGDDYELCCTIPPAKKKEVEALMQREGYKMACIGQITGDQKLVLQQDNQLIEQGNLQGYIHF